MPFDAKSFHKTKFEHRTAEVSVPALKPFFSEDEKPAFIVRGLTGNELARCNESVSARSQLMDIVNAIKSGNSADKVEQIKAAIGISGEDVPDENIKRFTFLELGSVEPRIDRDTAILINERFPVEFKSLTNKIIELTGLGMDLKKPLPSGKGASKT